MSIEITSISEQAKGIFANGAIIENKPIGFAQDGGIQMPYSNLFYWANAWSENGGLIGEHPHKMFEIMSIVIEGEIEHYDNKFDRWLSLKKGDAQVIRSGNGITHAEKILAGGRMFQIWFDPNIKKSILQDASYNDYKSEEMYVQQASGIIYKHYIGNGGPIQIESEGVSAKEITISYGNYELLLDTDKIHSYYMISGKTSIGNRELYEHDFIKIQDETSLNIRVNSETKLFEITVPKQLSYKTYLEHVKY